MYIGTKKFLGHYYENKTNHFLEKKTTFIKFSNFRLYPCCFREKGECWQAYLSRERIDITSYIGSRASESLTLQKMNFRNRLVLQCTLEKSLESN